MVWAYDDHDAESETTLRSYLRLQPVDAAAPRAFRQAERPGAPLATAPGQRADFHAARARWGLAERCPGPAAGGAQRARPAAHDTAHAGADQPSGAAGPHRPDGTEPIGPESWGRSHDRAGRHTCHHQHRRGLQTAERHCSQPYPCSDHSGLHDPTLELMRRAEGASYPTLVVTVDVPVLGNREAEGRVGMGSPPPLSPARVLGAMPRPGWCYRFLRHRRV
ncbi:alpha-hydroxy-acid oxidizing protein [Actinomadura rugatobispora]|uniref:Alpha-hydroxy-acid oxidizing protein n=1 Tax=Actinomadura rugatobispora TaxID=1994 RepID=A0ABW1A9D9_9ACTN